MSRTIGTVPAPTTITNMDVIGHTTSMFRSGANYKAVGESVQRSVCTALSAAFPRQSAFSSVDVAVASGAFLNTAFACNGALVVNVGTGASNAATDRYRLSRDGGKTWAFLQFPSVDYYSDVIFAGAQFMVAGKNNFLTSPDGITWTLRTIAGATSLHGWALAYGAGMYVAISLDHSTANNVAQSSPDGITWTARTLPTTSFWADITFGNGVFSAVAGKGFAGAATNAAASSVNGTSWTARVLPAAGDWRAVQFGTVAAAPLYMAVGLAGLVATSSDAVTWTQRVLPSNSMTLMDCYSVVWGDGVFMIGTNASGSNPSALITSNDGLAYRVRPITGYGNDWVVGAYGAGSFIFSSTLNANTKITLAYSENDTDSDYLYISGAAGQFVRVQ